MRMLAAQPAAVSGLALLTIVLVTSIALVISLAWAARRLTRQGRERTRGRGNGGRCPAR